MSDDPIRAYQAVLRDFNAAHLSVQEMVNVISQASKKMNRAWYSVNPVNSPGGYGYPQRCLEAAIKLI